MWQSVMYSSPHKVSIYPYILQMERDDNESNIFDEAMSNLD